MARTIWKYTLEPQEQRLWDREDMQGWCRAFQGWVEDEARELGLKKYIIYGGNGDVLAKDLVSALPETNVVEGRRAL